MNTVQSTESIPASRLELIEISNSINELVASRRSSRARQPNSDLAIGRLAAMSPEAFEKAHTALRFFAGILRDAQIYGVSPLDSKAFVSFALKSLGLSQPKEFLDSTKDDDIVEIYDLSGIQLFRNMRFFEVTSYCLADLLLFEWTELFERSSKVMELMHERCGQLLNGNTNMIPMSIPRHPIREILAEPSQIVMVEFGSLGLLRNKAGEPAGFIVNCGASNLFEEIEPGKLDFI